MWNFFLKLFGRSNPETTTDTAAVKPPTKKDKHGFFGKNPNDEINWGMSLGDPLSVSLREQEGQERQAAPPPEVKIEPSAMVSNSSNGLSPALRMHQLRALRPPPSPEVKRFQDTQAAVDRTRQGMLDNAKRNSTAEARRRDDDWVVQQAAFNHTTYNPSPAAPLYHGSNHSCKPAQDNSYNSNPNWSCPAPSPSNNSNYDNSSNYDSGSNSDSSSSSSCD